MAADEGCRTVAMPMLATGYGPLTPAEFAAGVARIGRAYGSVETLTIVVRKEEERVEVARGLEARGPGR